MIKKVRLLIILAFLFAGFFCIQNAGAQGKININIAGLEELDSLPGIGPAKAQAIIDYRAANGLFLAIEDITKVSGIGDATYNNLKDLITVSEDTPPYPSPSQGEGNSQEEASEPPATPPPASVPDEETEYKLGDIVINEFVSDPADEEVEWIELFNNTGRAVDLSGWWIEEGGGAKTVLTGAIDRFFVVEKPKGNLNNAGDIIILRDAEGNLIDQAAYGDWNDGDIANNAPAASDPNSAARKFDGVNNFNNLDDFTFTETPTKGASNNESEIRNHELGIYDYSSDIIISEIFPNPAGNDTDDEFIELFNEGSRNVDLKDLRIGDESERDFAFRDERIIKPGEYLAISRSESKIALNNTSDSVKIFQPDKDRPLKTIKYKDAFEGQSYALNPDNKWVWTDIITPGKVNIFKTVNHSPIAEFDCPEEILTGAPVIFDSSDTMDEDGDELKYSWDFGDGFINNLSSPEHTFFKQGNLAVKLTVNDGLNEVTREKIIKVVKVPSLFNETSTSSLENKIIINEILPDPEGADGDGEWAEIYNQGENKVNLLNWRLDDMEGGSQPYKIKSDIWLNVGSYLVINRPESGLAFNNTSDEVRLFNDLDELIDGVEYEAALENESYARGENGKWFWTTKSTSGEKNIIAISASQAAKTGIEDQAIKNLAYASEVELAEVKNFEAGDYIKTAGTVAVLPGILGSQYFYITGSPGLQVYSYKKDFPELKVGDFIEVTGELSEVNGEKRLKIKQKEDIKVLESGAALTAEETTCDKIDDESVGMLVKIAGEIMERKSSLIYLDDGSGEAEVYIKKSTGISVSEFSEGDKIEVTGIVSKTKTGLRVMPRSQDDIINKGNENNKGKVLGATSQNDEWALAARDKKMELFKYLLIIAGGAIVVLGGLLVKAMIRERK